MEQPTEYGRLSLLRVLNGAVFMMIKIERKTGFTLTELLVVVVVMALLVGIGVPAAKQLMSSFETTSGVQNTIEAALSAARALAIKEQTYAGVRFQKIWRDYDPDNAPHYMIFIVHEPGLAPFVNAFRAVEGLKPIRLAENFGVMDLWIKTDYIGDPEGTEELIQVIGNDSASDARIDEQREFDDTTTFSIIFSPSGKAVIHQAGVWNDFSANANDVFCLLG